MSKWVASESPNSSRVIHPAVYTAGYIPDSIATAHDFESHDDITEERLYQNIFASHFGQLAIIFLWTSGNLFHVAWQGN